MEYMLWREKVANRPKHWVRAVTACNSRCTFCLDSDTPRNVYLDEEEVKAELRRGIEELGADKVIISGGEASLHPKWFEFIRYAKEIGYDRVQTVTNGYMFGDKDFYEKSVQAGLGEITFSLHGHTPELHDRMTQTPDAFRRLMKGMVRGVRDPRLIINVDTVINKQNVGVLDKIVELCISVGVTEFDLLHVIPQAAAYENREELFYDPRDYIDVLHRVFRLTRHPRFVIWTNRFPVEFLEGLEDLIQDPHKMLDEVNGRRFHVRKYLDSGEALNCREPERCVHCFIEPFCTTMDRTMKRMNEDAWDVWAVGEERPDAATLEMPYGTSKLGVNVPEMGDISGIALPDNVGIHASVETPGPLNGTTLPSSPSTLVATSPAHLDAWLGEQELPENLSLEIHLTKETGQWMLDHRELLETQLDRIEVHQPTYEHLLDSSNNDYRDPRSFAESLQLPIRMSGLPACMTPGAQITGAPRILEKTLFEEETGRVGIRQLAKHHVKKHYRAKSLRCQECVVNDRCDGGHINMIRDQGLKILRPLSEGNASDDALRAQIELQQAQPIERIASGCDSQSAPRSLPGFAEPTDIVEDPLAVIERKRQARRERMKARASRSRKPDETPAPETASPAESRPENA